MLVPGHRERAASPLPAERPRPEPVLRADALLLESDRSRDALAPFKFACFGL